MVKFMRYSKIFRLYEVIQPYLQYSLHVENKLPAEKIAVIAPHPDDEAIACGGTIYKHTQSGGRADIIFCTSDGEPRDSEAVAASKILGCENKIELKYPVESLEKQEDFHLKLINIFEENDPEIVFVPFIIDNHTDHRAVNKALIKISKIKKFNFMIYAYPVWLPLYPNILIDISSVWEQKKRAIECYKSQLATRDYIKMSRSFGQYWAAVKGRGIDAAEVFFKASFNEYITIAKKI